MAFGDAADRPAVGVTWGIRKSLLSVDRETITD